MEAAAYPPQKEVQENFRETLVNGRLYYCDQTLPSKTKLVSYAEKNRLEPPKFRLSVINKGDPVNVRHYAIVELEGKRSRGSGRTMKSAEAAASCKYLNNDYLAVGDYLQLGNPVSAPKHKYPPSAKESSRKKTERFLERKRREAEAAAHRDAQVSEEGIVVPAQVQVNEAVQVQVGEALQVQVGEVLQVQVREAVHPKDKIAFIAYDIERSEGADDSEMIQLAYASGNKSESSYIKPSGTIDRYGSSIHKIEVKNGQLKKGRELLKTVPLKTALEKMIDFIKNCGEERENRVIICHGNDLKTLINQMTYCGLADQFMQSFGRAIDFLQVVSNDEQFEGQSKSLTKLNVHKNLSELILKEDLTRQELEENAHDAEFDSVLLYRVWLRYLSNMTELDATETINNFSLKADDGMLENARMFISKIASKRNRKLKSGKNHGIVYINGWQ